MSRHRARWTWIPATLAVVALLSAFGCRSGDAGGGTAASAGRGEKTSSFRDIGKRAASDLSLR